MRIVALSFFISALLCWSFFTRPLTTENATIGQLAPTFLVPQRNGKATFPASFHGKPTIINFWNSSCTFCRKESPDLNRIFAKASTFYFLSVNTGDDPDTVSQYIDDMKINFPVLMDKSREISHAFNVFGTPETFLISKEGIVIHHLPGPTTEQELLSLLAKLN